MKQKLDSFSKILLATATINYMASSIDGVRKSMNHVRSHQPDKEDWDKIHGESSTDFENALNEAVTDLGKVMEKLGNAINRRDAICAIDQYITTPAFNVIIHGHDNTEGNFDDL